MMTRAVAIAFSWVAFTNATASAQSPVVVSVDPGHGGGQTGVQHNGVDEKGVVLRMGFTLAEELLRRGYDAHLTRTRDVTVGLLDRLKMAEAENAAMLISLHINGSDDSLRHGVEIYTRTTDARSASLAEHLANALRVTGAPVAVLDRTHAFFESATVPVMMIELGFMTHPVEGRLMLSTSYHRELAQRIADGIAGYLTQRHPSR